MKYKIEGGEKLFGEIKISGNKNSVFPCMAAALLTLEKTRLENVSEIRDVDSLVEILTELGVSVQRDGHTLLIDTSELQKGDFPEDLMTKLRGSIVLVGAILARIGRVKFHHPGGDVIGKRSIQTHLEVFKLLGARVREEDLEYQINYHPQDFKEDITIFMPEASVTATENLILASVIGRRTIRIKNVAAEPHVADLCKMLVKMGAKIEGIGSNELTISGVAKLGGTSFSLGTDYIEVGTYIAAAAITGGEITLTNIDETNLDPVLIPLSQFGIEIQREKGKIRVKADKLKPVTKITTNIWPGFPTDLMSIAVILATQSRGITLCHDWMYEARMFFVDKLIAMGANITLADPHRVVVYGPSKLKGRELETPDIRAGMALVLAALIAKGESIINRAELIERGYEDAVGKLKSLGAKIERLD